MDYSEKSVNELFEELKSNGFFDSVAQNNSADSMLWIFILLALFIGFAPQDKSKEAYLQGKVDAYEKVIRRLF